MNIKERTTRAVATTISLMVVIMLTGCSGCGKKGNDVSATPISVSTSADTETVESKKENKSNVGMSADEVIKAAESASYKSGDASLDSLYTESDVPFTEDELFIQSHLENEFETYEMDSKLFRPIGTDYFIGCFEAGKTLLYSYDYNGDAVDVRRRVVYESKEKLLEANKSKNLSENSFSESGYAYHDNVLYVKLSDEGLFGIESSINKYTLLKKAAAGAYDKAGYIYYFSKPYHEDATSSYKYAGISEEEDAVITGVSGNSTLSENIVYDLFADIMNNKAVTDTEYRKLFTDSVDEDRIDTFYNMDFPNISDYENCDALIVAQKDNVAYAEIIMYTVPSGYVPGDKIENYMVGGIISYDESDSKWKFAHNDETWDFIKDTYYESILTPNAYDAMYEGMFCKRMWIPFNVDYPFVYEGAVAGRVMETYVDSADNFYVTVCFSNGTDSDVSLKSINNLVLVCESGVLCEVGCNLTDTVPAYGALYEQLYIPWDYMNYTSFSSISVGELTFELQ